MENNLVTLISEYPYIDPTLVQQVFFDNANCDMNLARSILNVIMIDRKHHRTAEATPKAAEKPDQLMEEEEEKAIPHQDMEFSINASFV